MFWFYFISIAVISDFCFLGQFGPGKAVGLLTCVPCPHLSALYPLPFLESSRAAVMGWLDQAPLGWGWTAVPPIPSTPLDNGYKMPLPQCLAVSGDCTSQLWRPWEEREALRPSACPPMEFAGLLLRPLGKINGLAS